MQIDPVVEPKVREALAASVAEEPERFDTAIQNLGASDDEYLRALELAFVIDAGAIFVIDDGELPSSSRLDYLASEFAQTNQWSGVSEESARTYLEALTSGQGPLDAMSPGDAAYAALAIGGWLLSAFPRGEGMKWTDFLDAVLLGLERREEAEG